MAGDPPPADPWILFLVRTLPGVGPEQVALWRATLQAQEMSPSDWLALTARNRARLFPLIESQEDVLARRLSECRRLMAQSGPEALWLLSPGDPLWPAAALEPMGSKAPEWIAGWGDATLLRRPHVAVVGSRSATPEAIQIAEIASRSLVDMGLGVISGGARGIDQAAHRAALRAGGTTVYVLAEGVAVAPDFQSHGDLDPGRVCLVSSVWPTQHFSTVEALARNRLIVALSQAVLVIAAESTGGSLRTGLASLEAKKPTLVVHHPEVTVHTAGNHRLRQAGATPLAAEVFQSGHAPAGLGQALGRAKASRPETPDLFGDTET